MNTPFVHKDSIVRKIWGNADTVLLVFAGSAAEFALNKAVDWLYFTGRLPADPLGRLFSTVHYAQQIVFADTDNALAAIDRITAIHKNVEAGRNSRIPDSAYLDVLFMLIDYSIRSAALLGHTLDKKQQAEIFDVFQRVGARMQLVGLPDNYTAWERMRAEYLQTNLIRSTFTVDLYKQYRRHLGPLRYYLLLQVQSILVPRKVRRLLALPKAPLFYPVVWLYRMSRWCRIDRLIKALLLPAAYKVEIAGLDRR